MENGYTTLDAEVTPISRSSAAMGGALQAPATAYCERLTGWATRWSYWNDALFRFYTAMNFCFNWDQVWDVESLGSWVEVYYPGWEYMSGDTWGYWDNMATHIKKRTRTSRCASPSAWATSIRGFNSTDTRTALGMSMRTE